jgi:hypothetical protein
VEKRFQVFISSTYEDLIIEREIVSLAVLRSRNIPSGMELSSGANERTLDVIYRWIDDCDIFLLLLGGTYGSVDQATGLSYTELEYRYAKSHSKPVIAMSLTDRYLARKVAQGMIEADTVYERKHKDTFAAFRDRVTGGSYCIAVSDVGELEAKVIAALDTVTPRYAWGGWVRTTTVVDHLVDLYARYTNLYLDLMGGESLTQREIEDLLRMANDVVRTFISQDLGWIDVMTPVVPVDADRRNLLLDGVDSPPGWLRILFSSVRRTGSPVLIPIEVNGTPWRGSGNAFLCGGIDYVSSFQGRYGDADYGLPPPVVDRIESTYAYWREQQYFSSLLAIAILSRADRGDRVAHPVGVLNLNFSVENALGADDALSPRRSTAIINVLDPTLQVLARVIDKQPTRKWRNR